MKIKGFIRLFNGDNTCKNEYASPDSIILNTFSTCATFIGDELKMYTEMIKYIQ